MTTEFQAAYAVSAVGESILAAVLDHLQWGPHKADDLWVQRHGVDYWTDDSLLWEAKNDVTSVTTKKFFIETGVVYGKQTKPGWCYYTVADVVVLLSGYDFVMVSPDVLRWKLYEWSRWFGVRTTKGTYPTGVGICVPIERVRELAYCSGDIRAFFEFDSVDCDQFKTALMNEALLNRGKYMENANDNLCY